MALMIACAAGRRGVGAIDCLVCSEKIHQRPNDPAWYDGEGSSVNSGSEPFGRVHAHAPAKEVGPTLGPFEYVDITYQTVRVDDGEVLATWDDRRGDWVLTGLAGDAAGEAYSDLTIHAKE